MIQYADDATLCINNINSIKHVIRLIDTFTKYAGPKLNLEKTKGIWLGKLKNHGYRLYENIKWTGNPVKCLGIYIGHNQKKCEIQNWDKRIDVIDKTLTNWQKRKLTIYGKVSVIKTYALSKIVYPASVLVVPERIVKSLKDKIFTYLWGKRDKVKRSNVINRMSHGGLNMVDIDCFLASLKAAWVVRLIDSSDAKWKDYIKMALSKIHIDLGYAVKMSFRTVDSFPAMRAISPFYQDVFLSFNNAKSVKPFDKLSDFEKMTLPLWGSEYFKIKTTCLYLKNFVEKNIMYVKDIVKPNGCFMLDNEIYDMCNNKQNAVRDMYILKNYVIKRFKYINVQNAPFTKIRHMTCIVFKNKLIQLNECTSKSFYKMLVTSKYSKGNMESVYAKDFNFENTSSLWKNIYQQKLNEMKMPKLKEFNYKILHNIIPCGMVLSKWKPGIDRTCKCCNTLETTKHMLYECERINQVWQTLSSVCNMSITWKNIACGFPKYADSYGSA